MKNPTFVAELQKRLGAPSSETVESLRLLKAFLKLAPGQRFEVIELVERLATDPGPPTTRCPDNRALLFQLPAGPAAGGRVAIA